jgi:hypothetical protein
LKAAGERCCDFRSCLSDGGLIRLGSFHLTV